MERTRWEEEEESLVSFAFCLFLFLLNLSDSSADLFSRRVFSSFSGKIAEKLHMGHGNK